MDDNVKKYKKILYLLIERTQYIDFELHSPIQHATVSFYKKMISSAKSVLHLYNDYYNACILASHMLEGLILLTWMLDKPKERVRQYADFGTIEFLEGLHIHPEEKDDILNFIKKNNLKRLLKKDIQGQELTDEVLLNPKNYYNKWYRPEVKDISDIVQKLTNNGNHPEITNIKHSYDRFCAYKHYAPYVMMPRYGTSMNIPNCDEFLAISISLQCLYITFMYVNLYQFNKTDIQDITQKYSRLTDFCPIR